MATTAHRCQSGETCRETGSYEFDGFVDGSTNPIPSPEEREVMVASGAPFPTPRGSTKACFWKPAKEDRDDDEPNREYKDDYKHDDDD